MNIKINDGEAFIKLKASDEGTLMVTYGYNLGAFRNKVMDDSISTEEMTALSTLVGAMSGIVTACREDLDIILEMGSEAIDEGFLDPENNIHSQVEEMTAEEFDLLTMEAKGNA